MQPKRQICDYLESQGIRVAERIATLQDALRDGHDFIIRGEHPQDYNGASDLLRSLWVSPEKHCAPERRTHQTEADIVDAASAGHSLAGMDHIRAHLPLLSQEAVTGMLVNMSRVTVEQYCKLLHISHEDFLRDISFSYWRYVDGCNHAIAADSAVKHRYHIFSCLVQKGANIASYLISDNGMLQEQAYEWEHHGVLEKRVPRLIELYEAIRALPKFDRTHCPIVEVQTTPDETDYCLQVHRARDFQESPLDFGPVKKEDTYFARGATPAEGRIYDVHLVSDCKHDGIPEEFRPFEGAYLISYSPAFIELNLKQRGMHLMQSTVKDDPYEAMKFAVKHANRSELLKPQVSVQVPIKHIVRKDEYPILHADSTASVPVKITSDGRRAIIERV